jgi:tetratricopeptide (TPR) repeat protein
MTAKLTDLISLWDYDNPGASEKKFRKLLQQAEKNNDVIYRTVILTQIARAEGLQRNFDTAHDTLDKVLDLLYVGNVTGRIMYLLERGRVHNSSNHPENAKPLFLQAYEEALMHNEDYYAIDAAHMLGIIEKRRDSLKWNMRAIALAETTKDLRAQRWLGALYNNTGWSFFDMKEYDIALDYFNRNIKWHTKRKSKKELVIARWCRARTLRAMDRVEDSLKLQMDLLNEVKQKNIEQDGYIYEEIGECLLSLGKKDESKKYFGLAYKLLSKDIWLSANEKPRLSRIKKLSDIK